MPRFVRAGAGRAPAECRSTPRRSRGSPTTRCISKCGDCRPTYETVEALVFPEIAGVVDNPAPVRQQWNGETWTASWPLSAQRSASPASFPLVLRFGEGRNLRVIAQLATAWPDGEVANASAAGPDAVGAAQPAWLPHRAAVRLVRRRDPEPHALRVPGVVVEDSRGHAARGRLAPALGRRAGLHRGRRAVVPRAGRAADRGACRR